MKKKKGEKKKSNISQEMNMITKKKRDYYYKLHSSFVSMRKQILNLQRGYNNYRMKDLLPESFQPVFISKLDFQKTEENTKKKNTGLKNKWLGKSFLEADSPYLLEDTSKFDEKDKAKNESISKEAAKNTVQRLTAGNIKNGSFFIFEEPTKELLSWLNIFLFLLIISHAILSIFEFSTWGYIFSEEFSILKNIFLDPFTLIIILLIDIFGFVSIILQKLRLVSLYSYTLIILLCYYCMVLSRPISLIRLGMELVTVILLFKKRHDMTRKWFSTSTLE